MLISNKNFIESKIPEIPPVSPSRLKYWKEQKRRCIEGVWSCGKWMPPELYFYVNFWHILLNEDVKTKTKSLGRPFLRDLEWEKAYILQEAKGFSGFEKDKEYTCLRLMSDDQIEITRILYPEVYEYYKSYTYIPARDYLRKIHNKALGRAKYENQCSNVIDIEARGTGKSYFAASNIAHNYLTSGATNYDNYLEKLKKKTPYSSETVVGAYDSKWSSDLLKKVKLGLSHLPGAIKFNGVIYPSPLYKEYSGSWTSGKTIINEYNIKEGDQWVTKGDSSKIQHRTFKDNPFAANGTRGNLNYIEEVGFMANLSRTLGAMKECTYNGDNKIGVIWCMGTGGDMEGGSTYQARKVFYNPTDYDCLYFDDIYEGKGKIGLFVPSHVGFNEFRNEEGILDVEKAKKKSEIRRETAAASTDKRVYTDEIQNRPEKPSEAFYNSTDNILDVPAIEDHIKNLEAGQEQSEIRGLYGNMIINNAGEVEFVRDTKNKLAPADFPVKKGKQPDGCVVIWELPDDDPQYGQYIAATDPYDQDKADNTTSMGSTFIMKRFTKEGITCKKIVAEYTGRPRLARMYYETVRRLLLFYNATDLYENEKNGMKMHFEQKHSLHLLADTPDIMKSADNSVKKVKTGKGRSNKGIGMPPKQQEDLIFFVKEYLETEVPNGNGELYMHTIKSIPLLKECSNFNLEYGNYDRMIALMLLILYDQQLYNIRVKNQKEKKKRDAFFSNFKNRMLGNNINSSYNKQESYIDQMKKEGKTPAFPNLLN